MTPTRTAADPVASPARNENDRPAVRPEARDRVGRAIRAWGLLTLGGILVITVLVLWHLRRRGQLLRNRLGPPRNARLSWDDLRKPTESGTQPDEAQP